jgi:putative transposase
LVESRHQDHQVKGDLKMQKRFSEEQIVSILREAETGDRSIGEVCRAHSVSESAFYRWRHHYGGMQLPEVKRLKDLEKENARLKRLLADRCLEVDAMKDVLAKNC